MVAMAVKRGSANRAVLGRESYLAPLGELSLAGWECHRDRLDARYQPSRGDTRHHPGNSPTSRTFRAARPQARSRPHRPHHCAAGRYPRRGHPARLAAGRTTRPGPGPGQDHALLRPGRHGGGAGRLPRAAQDPAVRGPWTLAATLELPRTLNVAIADPGAVADLTASLAEGAAAHAAEVAKRVARRPVRRAVRRAGPARRGRRPNGWCR